MLIHLTTSRNWVSMLDEARADVLAKHQGAPISAIRSALEREGVKTSLANLRTFPCLQILEGRGRIALHGTHFDIASGTLSVLNQGTGNFVPL